MIATVARYFVKEQISMLVQHTTAATELGRPVHHSSRAQA